MVTKRSGRVLAQKKSRWMAAIMLSALSTVVRNAFAAIAALLVVLSLAMSPFCSLAPAQTPNAKHVGETKSD